MNMPPNGAPISEPEILSSATYRSLDTRIVRLEEYRQSHQSEHDNNVATHAWVYQKGYVVVGLITLVVSGTVSGIIAALVRAAVG